MTEMPRCSLWITHAGRNQCGSTPPVVNGCWLNAGNVAMALTPAFTVLSPGVLAPANEIPTRVTGVSNGHGKSGTGMAITIFSDGGGVDFRTSYTSPISKNVLFTGCRFTW